MIESMKNGGELHIHIHPGHSRLYEYFGMFNIQLSRGFNPAKAIVVEKFNGVKAEMSEYSDALREFGFVSGYNG
jgi:hypothetical protein